MKTTITCLFLILFAIPLYAQKWTCLGPFTTPLDIGFAGTFVGVGMVTAIDFSRQDSNKVFIGAANGGVWLYNIKTDSSIPLNFDTVASYIGIASLVVDPVNDSNIYVATGDKLGPFDWNDNTTSTQGIYYTRNGGKSWHHSLFYNADNNPITFSYSRYNYHHIPKIIINPLNPHTIWCVEHELAWEGTPPANSGHIYVSYNAGETWHAVSSAAFKDAYFNDILYDPMDTTIIYAASHYLYHSIDGGRTWTDITDKLEGYTPEKSAVARICLSATPTYAITPTVGVLTLSEKDANRHHLYLVSNHFDSIVQPIKSTHLNAPDYNIKYKYGLCLSGIENTLYGYGTLFQASYNNGKTFTHYSYAQQMHPDVHFTAVSPHISQSQYVFVGTDGGLYISHNMGKNFTPHYKGFCTTEFYSVGVSASGKRVLGGSQDNGTLRCDNDTIWCRINGGGDGNNVLFNPYSTDTFLYGDFQGDEIYITQNGGKDFDARSITGTHAIPTPLAFETGHPLTFIVGTNDIWKIKPANASPMRLSNFRHLDSSKYDKNNHITCIATTLLDSNILYVGLTGQWQDAQGHISGKDKDIGWGDTSGFSLHQVYVTYNAGKTWKDITPIVWGGLGDISSMAVSAKNKKKIWITRDRWCNNNGKNVNVYMSSNGGKLWEPYFDGLPAVPTHKIICTPNDVLYVATNKGIYMRTSKMQQWQNVTYNLPHTLIKDMCYNAATHTLYAATWGRSIWKMEIKSRY